MKALLGLHHVTAITKDIKANYTFMTEVLGMRLVKKTVNQDDVRAYHTFYADDVGSAGTDVTFFEFPEGKKGIPGRNSVERIGLRVPSDEALDYYHQRLSDKGYKPSDIRELNGAQTFTFEEADGQKYRLYSDEHNTGIPAGAPWKEGPVDPKYAINGLGPIEIRVDHLEEYQSILEKLYGFRTVTHFDNHMILEVGEGGHGGQIMLTEDAHGELSKMGYGLVQHIAFNVEEGSGIEKWADTYDQEKILNSGVVDRYYFKAIYAPMGRIIVEIATNGPGFMVDEAYEDLGRSLSLPPKFEARRSKIENQLKEFNTQ